VVGNPLIADVTLQTAGLSSSLAKATARPISLRMDRAGEILMDRIIQVEGPTDQVVTIYRGVERSRIAAMPICQRRVTLGDGETTSRLRSTRPAPSTVRLPAAPPRQANRRN